MGTTVKKSVTCVKKDTVSVDSQKGTKRRIKFHCITREELERRRIPVYEYIL